MSTALATIDAAPLVTADQLDLIRKTIAKDATPDELKLYLFDCARQGVHPLDKLLHFTKRGGKYTPITSIDFMRTRAADTGDYAGSDDATFSDDGCSSGARPITAATVTVYRLVQGQRCSFTATARWTEYCPASGQDHMWRKMPHTMLAKCAEALALRKGFPRQLAGLYAKEEMDQAGEANGYTVSAPQGRTPARLPAGDPETAVAPSVGDTARSDPPFDVTQHGEELPHDGLLYISRVDITDTRNKNVRKALVTFSDTSQASTINPALTSLCEQCCQARTAIVIETKDTKWGRDLVTLHRADAAPATPDAVDHGVPLSDDDIPFAWLLPLLVPVLGLLGVA